MEQISKTGLGKELKRIALALGIVLGFFVLFLVASNWEPQSAYVKAYQLSLGAFLLCLFLIWYGSRRPKN